MSPPLDKPMKSLSLNMFVSDNIINMQFTAKITMVKNFTQAEKDNQRAQELLNQAILLLAPKGKNDEVAQKAQEFLAKIGG